MKSSGEDLVPLAVLEAWMDGQNLEKGAAIADVETLAGGTQNIILKFKRGAREFVLRRPPLHPAVDGNVTIRREAQVLAMLAATTVPHPPIIAACLTTDVLGAAFYLMEPIAGFNPTVTMPAHHSEDRSVRRRMGFALVDGIANLATVDYSTSGLTFKGEKVSYLNRQIERWRAQQDRYGRYNDEISAQTEEVAQWLERNVPISCELGIVHGDYHLANVMYRYDSPELAAIVDWELTTVGDPLLDLGSLIATWKDEDGPTTSSAEPWDGFPSIDELIARYGEKSSRDLSAIGWYGILACYRLAIILEGTYVRALAGKAKTATGNRLHGIALRLLRRAEKRIASA